MVFLPGQTVLPSGKGTGPLVLPMPGTVLGMECMPFSEWVVNGDIEETEQPPLKPRGHEEDTTGL